MNTPFALTVGDSSKFQAAVGDAIYNLPPWGGIFIWERRYVLVYPKPDGTFLYTDISGGIPYAKAPGGFIPAEELIRETSKAYVSPTVAFFSSLPQNFMDIAVERMKQVGGAIENAATSPVVGSVMILGLIAIGILYYAKK